MLQNVTDAYTWGKERKVLTEQQHRIPGLEMIGHHYEPKTSTVLSPHIHRNSMEIIYVVSGLQTYCIGSQQYTIQGNQFLITPADAPHSSGSAIYGRCETYWLRLYKDYCPGFLQMEEQAGKYLHQSIFSLTSPVITPVVSLKRPMREVFSLLTDSSALSHIRACALLQDVFSQMCLGTPAKSAASQEILQAAAYVADHIWDAIALEDLAQVIGMSLPGLKQRFQRELGISPREYINYMKIEKAKELLINSSQTMTEIAFALSFSSSNYFSLVFHRLTGKTPTDFRQESLDAR